MMKLLKNKVFKNASWIIACKIVQSVLGFIISILTARYLGPSNFGLINYAASLVSFAAPLMQLGLNAVIVQFLVEEPENEGGIVGTTITMNVIASIFCIIGVISFSLIANANEKETIIVVALYSVMLFFQATEMVQYWFQAKFLSKYTSIVSLIAYCIVSAYKIFLLITDKSVFWFAVSYSIDYLIISILLLIIYNKKSCQKLSFSFSVFKRMFKKGKYYIISNLMIVFFTQTDRIMLKLMTGDIQTGYYSCAVSCATMTEFVFAAILDSFRPLIFEKKRENESAYELNLIRLFSIITYLSILQSIVISIFANPIISVLYGNSYASSISILRVIVWYTIFSYLGAARNIWILAENKQRYLLLLNGIGAIMNIALNAVLIPSFGAEGAAIATLLTQIITNIVLPIFIKDIRRSVLLMLKSLNINNILNIFISSKSKKSNIE